MKWERFCLTKIKGELFTLIFILIEQVFVIASLIYFSKTMLFVSK